MFEAYSVAVRLSLTNMVSSGLALIARDVTGLDKSVLKLQESFNALKLIGVGWGLTKIGEGMLSSLEKPIEKAREYELAFTKFKTMNLGETVNKQADHFARSANIMGVSAKELMNTMSESVGLFGGFDVAKKLTPKLAALNAANSAIFQGKIGQIDEGGTRALMKFIDRRGGTHDEATFLRNLNLAQKMVTGSGGFIKFRDLDQFSQMGGTAFRGLSDDGILKMALLLQEQGGAKAGTALMSMYQNLIAGRTPKKTMALLQEYGLGTLAMETHATVGGKAIKTMVLKNIKGAELLQSNPPEWIRTVFLPALAAKGVTKEADILKATNDLLSNRTASNQASILSTQGLQVLRDANLAKNAMGADQTIEAYKNDPNSKFADYQAKWETALVNFGIAALPLATSLLEKITPWVAKLSQEMEKHPDLMSKIVLGFTGLGLAFTALGEVLKVVGVVKLFQLARAVTALSEASAVATAATAVGGGAGGVAGLSAAIGALCSPIGLAALALGTLALAIYAFRPMSQDEIDSYKTNGGAKLTKSAQERIAAGELNEKMPSVTPPPRIPIVVNTTVPVTVDGREIARAATKYQAQDASKPGWGSSGVDPHISMLQPAGRF